MLYGKRILILIPHPDDEVVGCAAAIRRAGNRGAEIHGAFLTTGVRGPDAFRLRGHRRYERRVQRRRSEALRAAEFLNVHPVFFQERPSRTLKSHLEDCREEILQAMDQWGIDQVWTPAYEGGHRDHDAVNALASTIREKADVWEFSEYNYVGGSVHGQEFPFPRGNEQTLVLDSSERHAKRAALSLYLSERINLKYVRIEKEVFRPLASYDYSIAPHPGKLFYQRFQWVPGISLIDHGSPVEVSRACVDFIQRHARTDGEGRVGLP